MKFVDNKGFDPQVIKDLKARIRSNGGTFLPVECDENPDGYQRFYFIGKFEGREVVYDATVYTLRWQHQRELFEVAEHKAARHFPHYRKITYKEDENGNLQPLDELEEEIGLFMAEVIMEMEEKGQVKVKEHLNLDPNIDFGIGFDAGLHVGGITARVIEKLVRDFNEDDLYLDDTLVTFETRQQEADAD